VATFLTPSLRPQFRALAASFVPETAAAAPAEWAALEATVERALAARPASLRRRLALFIRILDLFARLRLGRGLAALDGARRAAFLERVAASPLPLLRRGVWGLRTLVMLGWYTQPSVTRAIGYRAEPAGWDARR
jgi:hypothetical protein